MTHVSPLVLEHVRNPRNAGRFEIDAPGVLVGRAFGHEAHERVVLYLRVGAERIEAARFRASGCPALIAAASLFTERVSGLGRSAAGRIDAESLADALALPPHQRGKAQLVLEAFVAACAKWEDETS